SKRDWSSDVCSSDLQQRGFTRVTGFDQLKRRIDLSGQHYTWCFFTAKTVGAVLPLFFCQHSFKKRYFRHPEYLDSVGGVMRKIPSDFQRRPRDVIAFYFIRQPFIPGADFQCKLIDEFMYS